MIGDSENYLSGLMGATRPIWGTFCLVFSHFLAVGGNTFYWLEMRHFMFKKLPHITIYVCRWWEPLISAKRSATQQIGPMQQIQPIYINGGGVPLIIAK